MPNNLCVIKTTLPDSWREFEVTSFAQTLVESGAACVQHHKVSSTYKWDGKIQSETEWSLEIKVSNDKRESLIEEIQSLHPYDVPQLLIQVCESSHSYADWVNSQ